MAYTAYKTWTVGEILTAGNMNAQVRDNGLLGPEALATADGEVWVATAANQGQMESGATLRTSIGVAIGSDVQAWDAFLDDITGCCPQLVPLLLNVAEESLIRLMESLLGFSNLD